MRRKILVFICRHMTLCRFFQKFEWFNQATYKEARDIIDGKNLVKVELTYAEVETWANEHGLVLWSEDMSEKALEALKKERLNA